MASVTSSLVWKRVGPAVVMASASASTTWRSSSYGSETKCEEAPKKKPQTPEEFREGHGKMMEMMEGMYTKHTCGKLFREYHQCIYDECDKEHRVYVKKCIPIAQQAKACMEEYNIEYRKGCIAKYGEEQVVSFEKQFGVDPETKEKQRLERKAERLQMEKEMIDKYGEEKYMEGQKALGPPPFVHEDDKNSEETAESNDIGAPAAVAPEKKKKKPWYRFGF